MFRREDPDKVGVHSVLQRFRIPERLQGSFQFVYHVKVKERYDVNVAGARYSRSKTTVYPLGERCVAQTGAQSRHVIEIPLK